MLISDQNSIRKFAEQHFRECYGQFNGEFLVGWNEYETFDTSSNYKILIEISGMNDAASLLSAVKEELSNFDAKKCKACLCGVMVNNKFTMGDLAQFHDIIEETTGCGFKKPLRREILKNEDNSAYVLLFF